MTPDLFIFYEAPPRLSGGSILAGKELRAMSGVSPEPVDADLICASPKDEVPSDPGLEDLLPDTIMVQRIDPVPKGRKTLLQRIVGGQGGWHYAAVSKALALFPAEHKKPALIYSRSHPPASHLAALDLLDGPMAGVPWVAQFTEPWSQNPYYKSHMTRAALGRYEQRIFESATRLIFISEDMRDTMLANAGDKIRAKARVVPPVYEPTHYGKAGLPAGYPVARSGVSTLVHVGELSALRPPTALFEGLARFDLQNPELARKIKVNLVGRVEEFDTHVTLARLNDQVHHVLPAPYLQCLTAMQSADVLLVLEAPAPRSVFFSGKFTDYLGARRPILTIAPADSFAAKLTQSWSQQWCDVNDANAIAAVLKRVALNDLWAPPSPEVMEVYRSDKVGKQIYECLSEVRQGKDSES